MANPYFHAFKKSITDAVSQAAAATKAAVATATDVSNQVAIVAKDIAEDSVAAALGQCKALREYKLAGFTAVGGAHNNWKLFAAKTKKTGALYPDVSVWVLDKKGLLDTYKVGKQKVFDPYFEQERKACSQLMRLKHPGVIRLIEPVEETRSQIVLITEPVVGSLQCILNSFRDVPTAPEAYKNLQLSPLEIKHGLIHLVECLSFLHTEAKMVHCSICPGNIYLTADGSWKLAGFSHVVSCDPDNPTPSVGFDYSAGTDIWEQITKPPLAYVAPELVGNMGWAQQDLSGAADVFSLGAVAYELVTNTSLIPSKLSPNDYKPKVQQLANQPMTQVPAQLAGTLRFMLSCAAATRPAASAFAASEWFSSDVLLRALRFLDTVLQRDMLQKAAFFKDLEKFWNQMDARLLKNKVLPALLQEMREESTLLAALPVCISICQTLGKDDFMSVALPAFKPIFAMAQGETLMALMRNMHILCKLMTSDAMEESVQPLLLTALTNGAAKLQDEVVRVLHRIADDMSYQMIASVLPHLTEVSMRTTSLLVRTSCLGFMQRAVPRVGSDQANAMLDLCMQITSVDKSAGTVIAAYNLSDAISSRYGAEMTAMRVLPMLCPLLLAPGLTQQQFAECTRLLREMIGKVEMNRGAGEGAVKESNSAGGQAGAEVATWDTPLPMRTSRKPPPTSSHPQNSDFTAPTTPPTPSALPPSSTSVSSSLWETSDLFSLKSNNAPPQGPSPAAITATWDTATTTTPHPITTSRPPTSASQSSTPTHASTTPTSKPVPQPPRNVPMTLDRKQQPPHQQASVTTAVSNTYDMFGGLSINAGGGSNGTSNPLSNAGSVAGNFASSTSTSMQWPAPSSNSMKPSSSMNSMASLNNSQGDLFGGLSVAAVPVVPVLGPPPAPSHTIGGQSGIPAASLSLLGTPVSTTPNVGTSWMNASTNATPLRPMNPAPSSCPSSVASGMGTSSSMTNMAASMNMNNMNAPMNMGSIGGSSSMTSMGGVINNMGASGLGAATSNFSYDSMMGGASLGSGWMEGGSAFGGMQGSMGLQAAPFSASRMGPSGPAADPFSSLASVPSNVGMATVRTNSAASSGLGQLGPSLGSSLGPNRGPSSGQNVGMRPAGQAGMGGIGYAGVMGVQGVGGVGASNAALPDMFSGLSLGSAQHPAGGMRSMNATQPGMSGWGGIAVATPVVGMQVQPMRQPGSVAPSVTPRPDGSLI